VVVYDGGLDEATGKGERDMDSEDILEGMAEREILEFLTQNGYLEGAAHGIALQVIDKGRASLKGGQAGVFEKFIVEKYFDLECRRCHNEMPTSEILAALTEEDELCSWCRKMESNDD
jgi:hypothetical protein